MIFVLRKSSILLVTFVFGCAAGEPWVVLVRLMAKVKELAELKELSLPPPGPFDLKCPKLNIKEYEYRGTIYKVFWIYNDRVTDFLAGHSAECGITKFTKGASRIIAREVRASFVGSPSSSVRKCDSTSPFSYSVGQHDVFCTSALSLFSRLCCSGVLDLMKGISNNHS